MSKTCFVSANAIWPNETLHKKGREQTPKLFTVHGQVDGWEDLSIETLNQRHHEVRTKSNVRNRSTLDIGNDHIKSLSTGNTPTLTLKEGDTPASTPQHYYITHSHWGFQWSRNLGKRPGQESVATEGR